MKRKLAVLIDLSHDTQAGERNRIRRIDHQWRVRVRHVERIDGGEVARERQLASVGRQIEREF
jgi:hypothetical protein